MDVKPGQGAYAAGWRAGRNGRSPDANPFRALTLKHQRWREGFSDALVRPIALGRP